MSNVKELTFNEIELISGGGNNGQNASDRSYGYSTSGGVSGGRSNYPYYIGIVSGPGVAQNISGECATSIALGTFNVVAAGASRSSSAFASAAASALNDIGKTCNTSSSRNATPFR